MIRKITLVLAFGASLWAASDTQIISFVTAQIKDNPAIRIDNIRVTERNKLKEPKGWEAVNVMIDLTITKEGKSADYKTMEIFFTQGDIIAPELYDISGKSIKQRLLPVVDKERYDDMHLIAGHHKAKYRILLFSDPYCPFCKDFLGDVLALAKKNPDKVALYYYHYPVSTVHPAAPAMIRAMIAAELKGVRQVVERIAAADLNPKGDEDAVVASLNRTLGTALSKADLKTPAVEKHFKQDMEFAYAMMIKGTPTVFINGIPDPKREKFDAIMKELKK